eukprot:TRINITY_DN32596_c0_g1_i1.p1 TRINITY_DN32596_c0_g1~~TRINITY_DN32596_c0_g1_i1.p1  ORF type:complete len:133 (-),score=10.56 TRINITY_DN32596_c0_g1_i1:249-620(-)
MKMESQPMRRIVLAKEIRSPFCVANADGVMIHSMIVESVERGEQVSLSFEGVSRLTTAFLNAAIGQLYDEYDEATVGRLLHVVNTTENHDMKIKKTIDNAKRFFLDPPANRRIAREVLGEDEE